jgi:hypothetical protein
LKRAEVAQGGLRSEDGGSAQNCRSLAQDVAIVGLPKNLGPAHGLRPRECRKKFRRAQAELHLDA